MGFADIVGSGNIKRNASWCLWTGSPWDFGGEPNRLQRGDQEASPPQVERASDA
jgi:hypothetical protein